MEIKLTKDELYEASIACDKLKSKRVNGEYSGCDDCPLYVACDGQMITVVISEILEDD